MCDDLKNANLGTAQDAVFEHIGEARNLMTLDIGCGRGSFVNKLTKRGHTAFGVEPQAKAERTTTPDGGTVLKSGGESLPFEDGTFDLVTYCHALHHVPSNLLGKALEETKRVMKPKAALIVVEPLPVGPFYEIMQPIDDEAPLYAAVLKALHDPGQPFEHKAQSYIYSKPAYRHVDQLKKVIIRVDPTRAHAPLSAWNEFTKRFHLQPKSWLFGKRTLKNYSRVDTFGLA